MRLATLALEASRDMQFLAISRDGARLAASRVGRDHSFLWDTRSGARIAELPGTRAKFGPDGRLLVTTNRDDSRNLLDGRTGERQERIESFTQLLESGPAECVPSWIGDRKAILVRRPGLPERLVAIGRHYAVRELSPDGSALVVGAHGDGIVSLHDVETGEERWQWRVPLEGNSDSPLELFVRSGLVLVSHTLGTRQSVLDAKTGALLHHFQAPAPQPWSYTSRWLVLSESGPLAYVDGARLVVLDARSGTPLFAAEGAFRCPLAIAEDGAVAAAATEALHVFASDGSERERIQLPVIPWHLEVGDRVLASCAPGDQIRLWRL